MKQHESFLNRYSQNDKVPIRLIGSGFGHLPIDALKGFGLTQRKTHHFLISC